MNTYYGYTNILATIEANSIEEAYEKFREYIEQLDEEGIVWSCVNDVEMEEVE